MQMPTDRSASSFDEDLVFVDTGKLGGDHHENYPDECERPTKPWCWARAITSQVRFERVIIGSQRRHRFIAHRPLPWMPSAKKRHRRRNAWAYSSEPASLTRATWPTTWAYASRLSPSESVRGILAGAAAVFNGESAGVTEENLQSRLRGVTLMALSNKWGALVLTTA